MSKYLGIEFGSTRIKALLIDEKHNPVDSGDYTWKARFENGVWTYDLPEAIKGLKAALHGIDNLDDISAMGVSGMMHGHLAFDKDWNLLVPFRTWQCTITADAAKELTDLFGFNIPQRWSIAHLYQAILNKEEHVSKIAHITTLAGYMHYLLTGENVVGVGEASGIFPIDSNTCDYDKGMLDKFNNLIAKLNLPWKVEDVLPRVLPAGEIAGTLTKEGVNLADGLLKQGIPFAPPEGDMGTGMTATNAVAAATGNVSAGTSINAMVVLEHPLKNRYEEIDIIATPSGKPVAMVHCNNCTNETNAWVSLFKEVTELYGFSVPDSQLYRKLYEKSLEGDTDCDGVMVCNYMAGETIVHMNEGRPLVTRRPDSKFSLANFFRSQLYATIATLKLGLDILAREKVTIKSMTGHGGLFKTPGVGQRYMAAACNAPITCMETAGEGGPFGIALLAAYCVNKKAGQSLEDYLSKNVFDNVKGVTLEPQKEDIDGFNAYMEQYKKMLKVEQAAIENM